MVADERGRKWEGLLSHNLSVCLSVYLSVYLSVCVSFCLSLCLSVSLSVYFLLSVYVSFLLDCLLSVYSYTRLCVNLPTTLSINVSDLITCVIVYVQNLSRT